MAGNVLGPEWGALAGMPAEEGLKIMAKYATDLESKIEGSAPRRDDDDDDEPATPAAPRDPGTDGATRARTMHNRSVEPAATQFVGKREAARMQARKAIEAKGLSWDDFASEVETAMSTTDAAMQINPAAWTEAWWYCWGVAQRQTLESGTNTPPRSETHTDVRVHAGDMNADRGRRTPGRDDRPRIEDPEERKTKGKFERYLGIDISDEEWIRLQNEDVKTYEDYQRMQDDIASRRR